MKRLSFLLAIIASTVLPLAACTSVQYPITELEALQVASGANPKASGYLAVSVVIAAESFTGYPLLEFVILGQNNGPRLDLEVGEDALKASRNMAEGTPALFAVPAGTYQMAVSAIQIPGGVIKTHPFQQTTQMLSLEQHVPTFQIKAGEITHIGIIKLKFREIYHTAELFFQTQSSVAFRRPSNSVWQPYKPVLQKLPATYLRGSHGKSVGSEAWQWEQAEANAKEEPLPATY